MKYLITGGCGSLGQRLTKKLLSQGNKVVIYSRDEYKQHKMASEFKNPNLKFIIGDIRNLEKTVDSFKGVDYVIHAAALKHVPVGEEEPEEVVKTNIDGTLNVIKACKINKVKKAVYISTDKACSPKNLYGATKFISEKAFISANVGSKTVFTCVRYGNVVGSRGSIIEYILREKPKTIDITDPRMTRFWISLDQAVNLVMMALKKGCRGDIIVPRAPSTLVYEIFEWLNPDIKITVSGMRAGEKLHEAMVSYEESAHTKVYKKCFVIKSELLGAKYYDRNFEYSSAIAPKMTKKQFMKLI